MKSDMEFKITVIIMFKALMEKVDNMLNQRDTFKRGNYKDQLEM